MQWLSARPEKKVGTLHAYTEEVSFYYCAVGARVHDIQGVEAILDVFQKHGHTEIDTARVYTGGTSEQYLGKVNWRNRGLKLETKLYPTAVRLRLPALFLFRSWCWLGRTGI